MSCPVHDKNWERLVSYVGGDKDAAYAVFNAHGQKMPEIPTITQIKSDIKFKPKIFTNLERKVMMNNIFEYNKRHNSSHFIDFTKQSSESTVAPKLVLNFMPISSQMILPSGSMRTQATAGDVRVESPKKYSEIFTKEGNQFIVNGEVFSSYEDAENSIKKNDNFPLEVRFARQIKSGSIKDVLLDIENNSDSKRNKIIAKSLSNFDSNVKVEVLTNSEFNKKYSDYARRSNSENTPERSSGAFLSGDNLIILRESAKERTVLHEISHALSINSLNNNKIGKEFESKFQQWKQILIEKGVDLNTYALKNKEEFISEFFGNPEFSEMLKAIPSNKKRDFASIWHEILDFMNELLGGAKNSLYEEALSEIIDVMNTNEVMNSFMYTEFAPSKIYNDINDVDDLKKRMEKITKVLSNKAGILSRSTSETANKLSMMLNDLNKEIEFHIANAQYTEAIATLLQTIMNHEFKFMISDLSEHKSGGAKVNNGYLNRMDAAVRLYSKVVGDIEAVLDDNLDDPLFVGIRKNLETTFSNFHNQISIIERFVNTQTKRSAISTVRKILGDKYDGSIDDAFDKIESDVSNMSVWFGTLANSPDPIARAIYRSVVLQKIISEQEAANVGKDLLSAQLKLEKAGYKDMSIFQERYEGKKTGYLISPVNWGEYLVEEQRNKDEIANAMKTQFGYERSAIPKLNNMTKEEREVRDKIYLKFRDKYMADGGPESGWRPNPPRNPEYQKIVSNPTLMEYYTEFSKTLYRSKELLPKAYRSTQHARLLLPQIHNDIIETIKSGDNVAGKLKTRLKEQFITTEKDTNFGSRELLYDESNEIAKLVPIHYVSKLQDMNDLSSDMTSMATVFFEMAHKFQGLSNRLEDITLMQRALLEREFREGKNAGKFLQSKVAEMISNFLDTQVYGKEDQPIMVKIPGTNTEINASKVLNNIINHVRRVNLFFNIPTVVSGFMKSTIDLNLDKWIGNYINVESSKWAEGELMKTIPSIIENSGKRMKTGKAVLLFEKNGIYGDINKVFDRTNQTDRISRVTESDITYFTYELADLRIKGKLALAIYNNTRLVNEKFITKKQFDRLFKDDNTKKWSDYSNKTLYDAYEAINGQLKVKKEYEKYITKELEAEVRYTIETRGAIITGQITAYDRPELARGMIGKFLMLHRNWMASGITERFKGSVKNVMTGEMEEGYYRSSYTLLTKFMKESGSLRDKLAVWDTLEDYQKANCVKTLVDLAFAATVILMSMLLAELAEDEPDDYWIQYLSFQMNRIRLEQNAFIGVNEFMSILNSPTAASSLLETTTSVYKLAFDWNEIEYGAYEGMYQWEKALIKTSRFKNIWELRNAESIRQKNKFLMSKILN